MLLFVLPTYGEFAYAKLAAESFCRHTPDGTILLVDDCSPDYDNVDFMSWQVPIGRFHRFAFREWGGLTRSWNHGLRQARELEAEYVLAGNSDLLFTPQWSDALKLGLESGYGLVGPLSNAPGVTAKGLQEVQRYDSEYELTDDEKMLGRAADRLRTRYAGQYVTSPVNGFALFAKTTTWWQHAYDLEHPFRPRNDFNSKGQRNPTPLLTLNEDELQGRWRNAGVLSGIVLSSFVFHYRSVSRGDRFKKPGWYRHA